MKNASMRKMILCLIITVISANCKLFGQIEFVPDTTINSILLLQDISSSISFDSTLNSSVVIDSAELLDAVDGHPFVLFLNTSKTEYLMAMIHEGTWLFYFSEFEVGKISDSLLQRINIPYIVTQYQDFQTENNIHVGMSLEILEQLKGQDYVRTGNKIRYCYNSLDSEFLEYGGCEYFLECDLVNNKIFKFRFGYTAL